MVITSDKVEYEENTFKIFNYIRYTIYIVYITWLKLCISMAICEANYVLIFINWINENLWNKNNF